MGLFEMVENAVRRQTAKTVTADPRSFAEFATELMAGGKVYGYARSDQGFTGTPVLMVDPAFDVRQLPVQVEGQMYHILRLPRAEAQ